MMRDAIVLVNKKAQTCWFARTDLWFELRSLFNMYEYEYPRPAVAVDLIVLRVEDNRSKLLLIQRKNEPFAGTWAMPGGFLDENETLETAAARELLEETGTSATKLEQFKAYSAVDRDPRTRVISVIFVAEILASDVATAGDDAAKAQWFDIENLPKLAFDHENILKDYFKTTARD